MDTPIRLPKEWLDKQSPDKLLESLSILLKLKRWLEELYFLQDHLGQEKQLLH
jgi:hypothetical protein